MSQVQPRRAVNPARPTIQTENMRNVTIRSNLLAVLFVVGSVVALLDLTIPISIGRITTLVTNHPAATLLRDAWPQLASSVSNQIPSRQRPSGPATCRSSVIATPSVSPSTTSA